MNTTANDKNTTAAAKADASVPEVDTFDRSEFNFQFSKAKAEVTTIVQDASKKRPLFSKDVATARAKRAKIEAALATFIAEIDAAKLDA